MTNEAWVRGMAVLVTCLPDREMTQEMQTVRGQAMREDLQHLSDDAWWYAVKTARQALNWFPTIRQLLDFASEAPPPERPMLTGPPCERCDGTGLELVQVERNGLSYPARQRCACRPKPQAETPPAQPHRRQGQPAPLRVVKPEVVAAELERRGLA